MRNRKKNRMRVGSVVVAFAATAGAAAPGPQVTSSYVRPPGTPALPLIATPSVFDADMTPAPTAQRIRGSDRPVEQRLVTHGDIGQVTLSWVTPPQGGHGPQPLAGNFSTVFFGTSPYHLDRSATEIPGSAESYSCSEVGCGASNLGVPYTSGLLHSVSIGGLKPGAQYFWYVGDMDDPTAPPDSLGSCDSADLGAAGKVACGHRGVTESECTADLGCCWLKPDDDDRDYFDDPPCFYSSAGEVRSWRAIAAPYFERNSYCAGTHGCFPRPGVPV